MIQFLNNNNKIEFFFFSLKKFYFLPLLSFLKEREYDNLRARLDKLIQRSRISQTTPIGKQEIELSDPLLPTILSENASIQQENAKEIHENFDLASQLNKQVFTVHPFVENEDHVLNPIFHRILIYLYYSFWK